MPWKPLPSIAFAVATFPFQPTSPSELPLELGDELYIFEQGGRDGQWYRGYLVSPPSLLAGLTCIKGQTLEARIFSGIFPQNRVEVREVLGDNDGRRISTSNGRASSWTRPTSPGGLPNGKLLPHENGHVSWGTDSRRTEGTPDSLEKKPVKRLSQVNGIQTDQRETQIAAQSELLPSSRFSQRIPVSASSMPLTPLTPRSLHAQKPPAPVPMLKIGDETPTSSSEPLVDEIASCLREWHSTSLHEMLLAGQYSALDKMAKIVSHLDLARRQLLQDVLTAQERAVVREKAVWNLVRGNKMLNGEVIVRSPRQRGRLLTGEDSAVELTQLQSEMSLLNTKPVAQVEVSNALHHLLFEAKAVRGSRLGSLNFTISLCLKAFDGTLSPLSELYAIDLSSHEAFLNFSRSGKLKTLFSELSSSDIGEQGSASEPQPYLVARLYSTQPPKLSPALRTRSPASREAPLTNKNPNTINSSGKGSIRRGRASLMFGSKSKTGESPSRQRNPGDTADGRSLNQSLAPPKSADGKPGTPNGLRKPGLIRLDAVGVMPITQIMRQSKDAEPILTLWKAAGPDEEEIDNAGEVDDAVKSIMFSPTGKFVPYHAVSRLQVHLSPYVSPDAETLIKQNPTSMHMVSQTKKIGFSDAPTKIRSDIYITLSEASLPAGATLSHPEQGSLQTPVPTSLLNLQLTMEVRDFAGNRIDQCIFPASNSPGVTAWRTIVTENESRWDQTICLKIPPHQVPGSHLVMSVADAPEFPFALCWMPLWDNHAFIHDGYHSLVLHAYDKTTSSMINGKGAYLSLPWRAPNKHFGPNEQDVAAPAATLILESYLCSTEYSQDQTILGLINWKNQSGGQLLDLLRRLVFVSELEIVKQLRDVFNALFAILVGKAGETEYEDTIFNDLVTVLGIVHDRRFNLGPLVDDYAENDFQHPFATPCLLRSFSRLLQNASEPDSSRKLRAAIKVGRHIFKFISSARGQQKCKEEEIGVTKSNFKNDMLSILSELQLLMRDQSPVLIGSRTLIVQHFHLWLPELLASFSRNEVVRIALAFMDACTDVQGRLVLYRILLMKHYAELDAIFADESDWKNLISRTSVWLSPYWGRTEQMTQQWLDQVRLCSSVVSELCKYKSSALYDFLPKIADSYCVVNSENMQAKDYLSLLFASSIPFQNKKLSKKQPFNEALLELAALIATITKMPPSTPNTISERSISTFVLALLESQKSILNHQAYPDKWLSLHIYHHRTSMHVLEYVSAILTRSFLPSTDAAEQFDMEIWKAFLETLLLLVSSPSLALETFPEQRRRAVWKIAGDVRDNGANLLRNTWNAIGWDTEEESRTRYGLQKLGGYQVQYVPSLVGPVVELCLSVHEGLRHTAVGILQSMIVSEWELSEDLAMIEAEMIVGLDTVFKTRHLTETITQKLFIGELLDLFEPIAAIPDDPLWAALKALLSTIDELMDLLVGAHDGSITENIHTLRLLDFMKGMQKEDIFIRYVHDLAELHQKSHPTEAGLALQNHADLYEWDSEKKLPAIDSLGFPEQSAFERKEALYFQMVQHFEDGKAWAHALAAYRELAENYERTTFDFVKLARTQQSMGKAHEAITRDEKSHPRFFRVIYQGLGFSPALKDKEFIFEGSPSERMTTFTDRLLKLHPAAQIVHSAENIDIEGQYLQVFSVSAHRDLDHPVYQKERVPQAIRDHLLLSDLSQFSVTSKRQTYGTNVKEQWVEKTLFTTAESFPTILRRSEIVTLDEVRLSPLQTAVERTWRKTSDLLGLESRALSGEDPNNAALTEAIIQLLDLNNSTSTCLAHYYQFFSDLAPQINGESKEHKSEPPPLDRLHRALQVALSDHTLAIKRCLSTAYTRPSLQATRSDLFSRLTALYPDVQLSPPELSPSPSAAAVPLPTSPPPKISIDTPAPFPSPTKQHHASPSKQPHSRLSLNFLRGATSTILPERKSSHRATTKPSSSSATLPNGSLTELPEDPPPSTTATTLRNIPSRNSADHPHPFHRTSSDRAPSTARSRSRHSQTQSRARSTEPPHTQSASANASLAFLPPPPIDALPNPHLQSKTSLDHASVVTGGPGATIRGALSVSERGGVVSRDGSRPDTAGSFGPPSRGGSVVNGNGSAGGGGVKKRFSLANLSKGLRGKRSLMEGTVEE
ncbi:MAG: hypothetical protein Q9160_006371 [Pyrenula sp. 1 TL-2023]